MGDAGGETAQEFILRLRTEGQVYTGQEYARLVLRTFPDGTRLTLGDIANIARWIMSAVTETVSAACAANARWVIAAAVTGRGEGLRQLREVVPTGEEAPLERALLLRQLGGKAHRSHRPS